MKLVTYLQKKHRITRRDFSHMLREEAVFLNDELVESYNQVVAEGDILKVLLEGGEAFTETIQINFHAPRLVLFNKPKGYVVSKSDPHNKTIYELLPESWRKDFWYIGRLDKDSSGLLLLTNQPELVDRYENPQNNIYKVYEVEIDKPYRTKDIKKATNGMDLTDHGELPEKGEFSEFLSFVSVRYQRDKAGKYRLTITLNEGKKRHIRRVLRYLGYKIYTLRRVKVGKRHIGTIKPGKWKMEKKVK